MPTCLRPVNILIVLLTLPLKCYLIPTYRSNPGITREFLPQNEIVLVSGIERGVVGFRPLPPDRPPNCANLTFCESVDYYPYTHIKKISPDVKMHNDFITGKIVDDLVPRRDENDYDTFCRSIKRTIYPKLAQNKRQRWKYVINDEEDFIQGVEIEVCLNPGGQCHLMDKLPSGYISFCNQKYIHRKLLSLNNRGRAVVDTFQIPSGCCCAYKYKTVGRGNFRGRTETEDENEFETMFDK